MTVALGRSGILLAFLAAVVGAGTLAVGLARRRPSLLLAGRMYAWLVLGGAVVATAAIEHALITHDFQILYVAQNNSRQTPLLYDVTGMWSALQGSLLLWGLVLAGYGAAMVTRFRRRAADPFLGWATLVVYAISAFFFALMVGPANPFATVTGAPPANGPGPDPLLQNRVLVAFHPPLLYLGVVGFTVPFAFAIAALATGRVGERWQLETRRWTLFAWCFLTLGIVLGAWWSYQVLGWGGFWAWDPVENAALLPWLCATAYLHSTMAQERRGLLRVWNVSLLVAAFSLTLLGTFLTRSGVIQSVHAFSNSNLGPALLGLFLAVVVTSVVLIGWRGDALRGDGAIAHPFSREGAILLNNVAFAAFAAVVLVGTVFPLFAQAFQHQQVTVGAPYFDAATIPIVLTLLFLMALAPVLPWRRTTAETVGRRMLVPGVAAALVMAAATAAGTHGAELVAAYGLAAFAGTSALRSIVLAVTASHRAGAGALHGALGRSSGGMVVHLGIVVVAVAAASATSFGHRGQVTLRQGQSTRIFATSLTYERTATLATPAETSIVSYVLVDGSKVLRPALSQFGSATTFVGSPSVASNVRRDVYLTLVSPPTAKAGAVTIGVIVQPLVAWLWIGGGMVLLGSLIAAAPRRRRGRSQPARSSRAEPGARGGQGAPTPEVPAGSEPASGDGSPAGRTRPLSPVGRFGVVAPEALRGGGEPT